MGSSRRTQIFSLLLWIFSIAVQASPAPNNLGPGLEYCSSVNCGGTCFNPKGEAGSSGSTIPLQGSPATRELHDQILPDIFSNGTWSSPDSQLDKRVLPPVGNANSHVSSLSASITRAGTWVHQSNSGTTWNIFTLPQTGGNSAVGVNGIYGCTSVMVISAKAAFISHIWEANAFITNNVPNDDATFQREAITPITDALRPHVEIGEIFSQQFTPIIVVLSVAPTAAQKANGINTQFLYQDRVTQLANAVHGVVNTALADPIGINYERTNKAASTNDNGVAGRAIVEITPYQETTTHPNCKFHMGAWRLWTEAQLRIPEQQFIAGADMSTQDQGGQGG